MLNSVGILAVGVGDFIYDQFYKKDSHIFILIDHKANSSIFNELMEYIMDKNYYEDDYSYDNLLEGRRDELIEESIQICSQFYMDLIRISSHVDEKHLVHRKYLSLLRSLISMLSIEQIFTMYDEVTKKQKLLHKQSNLNLQLLLESLFIALSHNEKRVAN